MDLQTALDWASAKRNAVLITLRSDGRAQSSDISFTVVDGTFLISMTDDRAKTRNIRRDNRVVIHITDPPAWSYVSFDATASLSPVASAPDDDTTEQLVAYYRAVAGQDHPDWDDYRAAMVAEGRLLATVTPTKAVGQIPTG